MSGSVGLPVAANWEQWAQGGFMPPLGAGSGPTGPLASTPGAPPAIDPATPAGAGALSPATLNQTTPAPLAPEYPRASEDFGITPQPAEPPVAAPPAPPPTPKAPVLAAAQAAMPPAGVDRNGTAPVVSPAPDPVVPAVAPAAPAAAPVAAPTDGANLARGMRNNNPLNLEYRDGQPYTNGQDGRFGTYPDMASGVAANTRQLLLNQDAGLQTVRQQVTHWVSDPKADLTSYIADISKALGVGPDDKIDVRNPDVASKFILAAQPHESGPTTLDPNVVKQGVVMGLDAKTWKPGTATMVAGPAGTTAAPPVAGTPATTTPEPTPPFELPYSPEELRQPRGSALLALASGLLSGPNFSQGLGKGLQAMNALNTNDIANKRDVNQEALAAHQAQLRNEYQMILARNSTARVDQGDRRLNQGDTRLVQGQQRVDQTGQALANRFDPVVKANMAQGAESGKDAAEDIAAIQNSTAADMQSLAETQQARALIAKNPEMMGPTLQARATRSLAELGIAGDPNTLNAIQKMTAENRNTYLSSLTGGHVGGIRSNQELKNLSQAVADIGTSPAAADWIIQLQQRQLQQKMAWRDELNRRQTEDPQSVVGSNYLRSKSEFAKKYFEENPIPDYTGGMAAPNASAAAPAQHGPVTQVLHYDAQGNQIK